MYRSLYWSTSHQDFQFNVNKVLPNPLKITLQSVRHTYIMTLIMTLLRQLCKRQLVLPLSSQECYLCWHLLIGMKHQNTLVGQPRTAIENCPVKLTEVEHIE